MRKVSREMPAEWAYEIMDKAPYITVAMTDEDGTPYAVPLSLARTGEKTFYFHGAMEGKKLDIISMTLSGVFLYFAQRTIPVSTAYIIWTGLGAIGTLLIGILFFGDSASLLRMFFALLTLVGIIGLELTSK